MSETTQDRPSYEEAREQLMEVVRTSGPATTLVVGHDVPEPQVTAYAASLR